MDRTDEARKVAASKVCPTCKAGFDAASDLTACPYDNTALDDESTESSINALAERYEILSMAGKGGWSTVYKARQKALNRIVAVKILHHNLVQDEVKVQRFKVEAEAISRLKHPNIIAVHDFGILPSGQPYIVADYVDGQTIADILIAEEYLPYERAIPLFIQVADALDNAHKNNVVHRDIKPGNVLISQAGKPGETAQLLDFGLAKFTDDVDTPNLTQSGHTLGTPAYMSPEQCMGLPLDRRCDVYSFGCLMYEVVTGTSPFTGKTPFDSMSKHMHETPPDLVSARPSLTVPAELDAVIFKALEKDPKRRFQNMEEVKTALRSVSAATQVSGKHKRRGSRHRRVVQMARGIGLSLVGVVAVGLFVGNMFFSSKDVTNSPTASFETEAQVQKQINDGEKYFDEENFSSARNEFKSAFEKSGALGTQHKLYARSLVRWRDCAAALGDGPQLRSLEPLIARLNTHDYLEHWGDPGENSEKILNLYFKLEQDDASTREYEQLVQTMNHQAVLFIQDEKIAKAKNFLQKALRIGEQKLPADSLEIGKTLGSLGWVAFKEHDYPRAKQLYNQSIAIKKKFLAPDDPSLARSYRSLSMVYQGQGAYGQATDLLLQSKAIYEKALGKNNGEVAWCLNNLGLIKLAEQDFDSAEPLLNDALNMRKDTLGTKHIDVARSMVNLGELEMARHRYVDAEKLFEEALPIYEKELGPSHPDVAICLQGLAESFQKQGITDKEKTARTRIRHIQQRQTNG